MRGLSAPGQQREDVVRRARCRLTPRPAVSCAARWWLLCWPSRRPSSPTTSYSDSSRAAVGVCWNRASTGSSFRGKPGLRSNRSGGPTTDGPAGLATGEERVSCRFVRKPWFDGIPGTRDATVELGVTQSYCTSTGSLVDVAGTGSPAWRAAALPPRHSAQVRGERDITVPGTGGGRCCGDTPSCRPSDHRERAFG